MHELVQQIARVDFSFEIDGGSLDASRQDAPFHWCKFDALIAGHQLGRSYAAPASGIHTLGAFKYLLLDKDAVFQRM
jgi:hypothetical protein